MDNLLIVGTSHIASQSVKEVNEAFEGFRPDIIAVELDPHRLYALTHKQKGFSFRDAMSVGFTGFLFSLIGGFIQKRLGRIVGMDPGSEMLEAVRIAKAKKVRFALIDQDIQITLARFSKSLTWREKFRIVGDIFSGIFFRKRQMSKYGLDSIDLDKVPEQELIRKMISIIRKRYPNIYKVLIHERNRYMADRLSYILEHEPDRRVLAVVGAGHKDGMEKMLSKGAAPASPDYSFSYEFKS
ncbi:TraB/GumN family protein [Candidatus Woesearchaeota archaeon]|nr:TraB/GumN family protein [Candidatus Woesearchaeota archaeon]